MKTNKKFIPKLQNVCGKDDLRPDMQYIEINKEYIVSTNAYIISFNQTSTIIDEGINEITTPLYIHKKEWELIIKMSPDSIRVCPYEYPKHSKLTLFKNNVFLAEFILKTKEDVKYPDYSRFLTHEFNEVNYIGFNIDLLYDLKEALFKNNTIKLSFNGLNRAIKVENSNNTDEDKSFGIIMPIMC